MYTDYAREGPGSRFTSHAIESHNMAIKSWRENKFIMQDSGMHLASVQMCRPCDLLEGWKWAERK